MLTLAPGLVLTLLLLWEEAPCWLLLESAPRLVLTLLLLWEKAPCWLLLELFMWYRFRPLSEGRCCAQGRAIGVGQSKKWLA